MIEAYPVIGMLQRKYPYCGMRYLHNCRLWLNNWQKSLVLLCGKGGES